MRKTLKTLGRINIIFVKYLAGIILIFTMLFCEATYTNAGTIIQQSV